MKNTTGTKLAFLGLACTILYFRYRSSFMLDRYNSKPEIRHYLNRLIEFYDLSALDNVRQSFFEMLDYGLDADQAFHLLISKVTK